MSFMGKDPEELRREAFLARAKEAEQRAAMAVEATIRESWRKAIAIWRAGAERGTVRPERK